MTDFNSYGDETLVGLQPLFFRVADRMRLEGYVAALVDDNMSLSLVSGHEAILDHYGKLLVARLREAAPHIGLEVYFPASADALITRFNEVLQTYSIEDAMGNKAPAAQPKIWIVHDASSLPDHEIQLLARLVQHFPAANIRVVMLLTTASKKQRLLASFGRRIMNWEIEPPSEEQAQLMLELARAQGREGAVSALLKRMAPWGKQPGLLQAQSPPSQAPQFQALPANASAVEPEPATQTDAQRAESAAKTTTQATKASTRRWLPWLAGGVALLGLCASVVLSLYGGSLNIDWTAWTGKQALVAPPPAPAASAPAEQSVQAAVPPESAGAPMEAPASAPGAPTNALGDPANGGNLGPAKAAYPVGAAAPIAPVVPVVPVVPAAVGNAPRNAVVAAANEVEEIIPTPSQAQVGQAWVRQMPPGTFLVQHTIEPSYAEATTWLQAHGNLRLARIVATTLSSQTGVKFAVVSGPFSSMGEASRFANSSGVPKDPQIRTARSMKERFAP